MVFRDAKCLRHANVLLHAEAMEAAQSFGDATHAVVTRVLEHESTGCKR